MKKKLIYGLAFIGMSTLLAGCHMKHEWVEATCTEPRTCSVGGETEGEALGHTWVDATCTEPKICSVCGETEGEALGHTWAEATYETPKTCSVCSLTEGEPLPQPYADANGLEFFKDISFTSKGIRYNVDMPEDYETIDADVEITDIMIEDADSGKEQTVTITYTVKGRISHDRLAIVVPHFRIWDIYTGGIVPDASILKDGQVSGSVTLEWDGVAYSIGQEKYSQWEQHGWDENVDGGTSVMENTLVVVITVPKDYDGLALYMGFEDEYRKLHYGNNGENSEGDGGEAAIRYILDTFEDGDYLIKVRDAFEMLSPSDESKPEDSTDVAVDNEFLEEDAYQMDNAQLNSVNDPVLNGEAKFKENRTPVQSGEIIGKHLIEGYDSSQYNAFDLQVMFEKHYGKELDINSCSYIADWCAWELSEVDIDVPEDSLQYKIEAAAILKDMGVFTDDIITSIGVSVESCNNFINQLKAE